MEDRTRSQEMLKHALYLDMVKTYPAMTENMFDQALVSIQRGDTIPGPDSGPAIVWAFLWQTLRKAGLA